MPYIYRIENKITKEFYYGARYVETTLPEDDIWVTYFTSSKSVKSLIDKYGLSSFDVEIISTLQDKDVCYKSEQDIIKENIDNPLCLNKQYTECGHKIFLNKGHSEETKKKMSISLKGSVPWNKGLSVPEEVRLKISMSGKGKSGSKKGVKKGPRPAEVTKKIIETRRLKRLKQQDTKKTDGS